MTELTHFDQAGNAHMVDVGAKDQTHRVARAQGFIRMKPETFAMIAQGTAKKGDVIGIARVAAIMASKRTADLIPLCHPIALTRVAVDFELDEAHSAVRCVATCETGGVDRRAGGAFDHLRHVQGRGPFHGNRWRQAA